VPDVLVRTLHAKRRLRVELLCHSASVRASRR
jgi:hypothetical protein